MTWIWVCWVLCQLLVRAYSGHLTSTVDAICTLLTRPCWWYSPPKRSTLSNRAFPVASACGWNSLPSSVGNAPSLMTFHCELKTVLFGRHLTMIRRSWLYCTEQLLSARDYWLSALNVFCLILYGDVLPSLPFRSLLPLQCPWHDSVILISTLLLTYLLTNLERKLAKRLWFCYRRMYSG